MHEFTQQNVPGSEIQRFGVIGGSKVDSNSYLIRFNHISRLATRLMLGARLTRTTIEKPKDALKETKQSNEANLLWTNF